MQQFAVVVREIRNFLVSFRIVKLMLPYHLHLLFGGLGILFLREILYRSASYTNFDTLSTIFDDIPLYLIAYYGFFAGIWLTLISPNIKFLAYALWGYAFVALYPFESFTLFEIVRAAIYTVGGYALFRFAATSESKNDPHSLNV